MKQYDENAEKYGYEGEMTPLKCEELKTYGMADPAIGDEYEMYKVAEVDAAITELKEAWRSEHEACEALKQKLEDAKASHYAEMVDAGMRERRLKRAFYKACAMWADRTRLICSVFGSNAPKIRWERMYENCLVKARKYK